MKVVNKVHIDYLQSANGLFNSFSERTFPAFPRICPLVGNITFGSNSCHRLDPVICNIKTS